MSVGLQKKLAEACPSCGEIMKWDDEYIVWCEACDHNINPSSKEVSLKRLDLIYEKLGRKFGASMLHQVSERQSLRPGLSMPRLLAYLLAGCVHMISLLFLVGSIYCIANWDGRFWFVLFGLFLLGLSWVTRPRFGKLEKNETIVSREEHPALYKVVDELCAAAGVRPIDGIVIDHQFNASVSTIGLRGKKILTVGLPLFTILPKEERIALLGHEVGHIANRDLGRSVFVGGAITTLATWYDLLDVQTVDEVEGIFGLISAFSMKGVALIPYGFYLIMIHLLWQDKQRAEYYADLVAADLTGTKASISLMEKILYSQVFYHTVQKAAVTKSGSQLLTSLREKIEKLPSKEIRRLKRLSQLELSKLNLTHPPNAYRIQFLEKQPFFTSRLSITDEQNNKIDRELALHEERIQETLVYEYLDSLYY